MKNYIQKLREKIGNEKFIHPAARIIIENDKNEFLFITKKDNGALGIPAGGFEENETIEECIKREVKEETGLDIIDMNVIGISSKPNIEFVEYPNGDKIQYFTIEFYSNQWEGKLKINDKTEIKSVQFMSAENVEKLPLNELSTFISLSYFRETKSILLK